MKIAALGDIHIYQLITWPWHLLGKRSLGMANLWLRRRGLFNIALLQNVLDQITAIKPDVVLFTGDFTTTALHREFASLQVILEPFLQSHRGVIVPGNHDRYSFASHRTRRMETYFGQHMPKTYPHVEQLTDTWQLMAIDSAVPRVSTSRGRLGDTQLNAITQKLSQMKTDQGMIVLSHYPVVTPDDVNMLAHHRLEEAQALAQALRECPGQIIMFHGHVHRPWHLPVTDRFTDINVGSPTMTRPPTIHGQGFWEVHLPDTATNQPSYIHHEPQHQISALTGKIEWLSTVVP